MDKLFLRLQNQSHLESELKENIDAGLTVWFEPVGDKSKLRNMRGIKFQSE